VTDTAENASFAVIGDRILYPEAYKSARPRLRFLELATGTELYAVDGPTVAPLGADLKAVVAEPEVAVFAVWDEKALLGWDVQAARPLWKTALWARAVVCVGGTLLAISWEGATVHCLDGASGTENWRLDLPRHSQYSLVKAAAVLEDGDLIVVTIDGQHLRVDTASGTVRTERLVPGVVGTIAITEHEVLHIGVDEMTAVDHRSMEEAWRLDTRQALRPYYPDAWRAVCGVHVGRECLIWTTIQGALMGASLERGRGIGNVWMDRLPNARFPLGEGPQVIGDYLYVTPAVAENESVGLYCYRPSASSALSS
jgi:hypothetical protein